MSPVIIEKAGKVVMTVGAAGGTRIPTSVAQIIWNVLDRNMTLYGALNAPRVHDQLAPNVTYLEWGFDNRTADFLAYRRHVIGRVPPVMSSAQALFRFPNGTFVAQGEPRQYDSAGVAV
jgi:gamma-glutamyltranspeptidase/glutathione hydrolase